MSRLILWVPMWAASVVLFWGAGAPEYAKIAAVAVGWAMSVLAALAFIGTLVTPRRETPPRSLATRVVGRITMLAFVAAVAYAEAYIVAGITLACWLWVNLAD